MRRHRPPIDPCALRRGLGLSAHGAWTGRALGLLSACILWVVIAPLLARAQDPRGEYTVKAAFLYNFGKFIEWPTEAFPDSHTPLSLCVAGSDPFGPALDALASKSLKGRAVQVLRLAPSSAMSQCHILFLSESAMPRHAAIVATLTNGQTLTVCDTPHCAEQGVMIYLKTVDDKIALEMNLKAVRQTRLTVSAQLLKLASIVEEE